MAISKDEEKELVDLLVQDILATLGRDYRETVEREAALCRTFITDPDWFAYRLVQGVQQDFHDTCVHTTWPACPYHPNHPMWFEAGWWCADDWPVARLGELGSWLRSLRG